MRKILIALIFVLSLTSCKFLPAVEYEYTLFAGQDTVEINTAWTDKGAVMYFDGDAVTPVKYGTVNTSILGLYKIEYRKTYEETEYIIVRYVIVVDETPPLLTLLPGIDSLTKGTEWDDEGITVVDNSLEVLTYTTTGIVNINVAGRYVVTYTAIDSSGNESSIDRIVNILN